MKGDRNGSVREDGPHRELEQRGDRDICTSGESTEEMEASVMESTNGLELGPLENPVISGNQRYKG